MAEAVRLEITVDDRGSPVIKAVSQSLDDLGKKAGGAAGGQLKLNDAANQAVRVFGDFGVQLGGTTGRIAGALGPMGLLAGTIGAGLVGATIGAVNSFQKFAFEVRDLSYLSGGSAKDVAGLVTAMEDLGVESGTVDTAINKMSKAVVNGDPALARLGISVRTSSGALKDGLTLFYETIDALGGMRNEVERNQLAAAIFGRGWMSMIRPIQQGSDAIKKLGEENAALGKTMSEEGIRAAEDYRRALVDLKDVWEGLVNTFGGEAIPAVAALAKEMAGPAVAAARLMVGVFQEVASTAFLLAGSLAHTVRPFAWLTDTARLTTNAYKDWTEWADIAGNASRALADKGLANLTLESGKAESSSQSLHRQVQNGVEIYLREEAALRRSARAYRETTGEIAVRLKYEQQLAHLQESTAAARAGAMPQGMARIAAEEAAALDAVNAKLKTTRSELENQRKDADPQERWRFEKLEGAAIAQAEAERARIRFQAEEARRADQDKTTARDIAGWVAYAEEQIRLDDMVAQNELKTQEGLNAATEQMRQNEIAGWVAVAEAEIEASDQAAREKVKRYEEMYALQEKTLAGTLSSLDKETLAVQQAVAAGVLTRQQGAQQVAQIEERANVARIADEKTTALQKYDAEEDFFEKVKLGLEISTKSYETASRRQLRITQDFAQAATRSLDDLYFSVLTGKFTSFGDFLKNFWSNIARVISNELATSTASWFSSLLKSGGGGGSGSVAGAASTVVSVVSDIWSWLGSLDEGMWKVPGGAGAGSTYGGNWKSTRRGTGSGGGSAWIHPDEMVVPADIAELLRQAVGRAGGRGFGDLEDLLQGGGGRGVSAPSSGAYGPMSQAEKESLSEIGGFQNRDLSVSSAFGALASVVGAGKLGKTALDAMISSILAFEAVRANLGVSSSFGYKQMDPVDIQAVQDLYGPEAARREAVEDAIMASIDADKRNALGLGAAAVASARANVSKEANEYEGGFRDPGIDTDTASFGGYGRGDPGYGDSPGMGDPGGGDGGGRTGDSNDPGGPSADDGSGMSLAAGALFRTRGRTRLTVGEAGSETVAVLRNPREVMAGGGGGGNRLTVNLSIGHVYGPGGIGEAARVLMAEIGRLESRRIKY